ncbi:response regulator transcription factor [Fimbriiglobus ruber]|uniref:Response regulatory domain-containing protein n=1 Tax=Fimbriiglobus ruber TaxID=1908690 RepID=A0A225DBU2_9BACT|nr:response regulator transcription factor [Fimbriiglobus ruber]OWK34766.1 hypothetical protein FRUB_09608 [Fimbriiglobus ruber]
MGLRTTTLALTWAVCGLACAPLAAQPPAAPRPGAGDAPKTPAEIFRAARDHIREGRFDVAAEALKAFLAATANSDADLLKLQENEPTVFLKLRNVPVWSDEPQAQAEAKKTVEAIIARAEEANKKFYRDPKRIEKFVRNLGATYEERVYAEDQLKKSGDAVVPIMVELLRTIPDYDTRTGILGLITKLGRDTVPGFLAATDGLSEDIKLGIFRAIASRPDALGLTTDADTDFVPFLWYYASARNNDARALQAFCADLLVKLIGPKSAQRPAEAELTRIASTFVARTERFPSDPFKLWTWDAGKLNVVENTANKSQGEEYYAVRYLRWALERDQNYIPAQEQFVTLTVERAVERARFGDLAQADPNLYRVLSAASSDLLVGLLDRGLTAGRTPLVLGLTQMLASRSDKLAAAGAGSGKPSVFVRGLDYPDPRVQLAAAVGLLRAPIPATHGKTARVIEILRRAAASEALPPEAGKEVGRALVVDSNDIRANRLTDYLHQIGYRTERLLSSRELLRRVAGASDFDLLVIDRHAVNPELQDLLVQLRADTNNARRPVLVVASTDKPNPIPLVNQLLRLALLVAATETSDIKVLPPFAFDPTKPDTNLTEDRARVRKLRDAQLQELFDLRLARLTRLVHAADLPQSDDLQGRLTLRLPQLTYAALAAEYPITADSAPDIAKRIETLNQAILSQPKLARGLPGVQSETLGKLIETLYGALDAGRRQHFEQIAARVNVEALGIQPATSRDPELEEQLAKLARFLPGLKVIPEAFTVVGLSDDIAAAAPDPAQLPRDPAEKRKAAKIGVEWLRRLALGEVPGYDVRPAEPALREATRDDELADGALDALAKIQTAEAQQDILSVALNVTRPIPIRVKAADRVVQHIQTFGKLIPPNQALGLSKAAEEDANIEMKARLLVIQELIVGKPGDLGALISKYPVPAPQVMPAAPMPKDPAAAPQPAPVEKDK